MREPAVVGTPSVQKMSLTATGIAAQRPVRDLVAVAVLAAPEVGVELVARRGLPPGLEVLLARELARGDLRRRLGDGQLEQLAIISACGEGTRKAPSSGSGACASATSRGQLGRGSSGAQHVLELDHVRGRLDAVEVELGDPVDVLEDPRELAGHPSRPRPRRGRRRASFARRAEPAPARSRRRILGGVGVRPPVWLPSQLESRADAGRAAERFVGPRPAPARAQLRGRRHPLHRRPQRRPRRDLRPRRLVRQLHPRPARQRAALAGARPSPTWS